MFLVFMHIRNYRPSILVSNLHCVSIKSTKYVGFLDYSVWYALLLQVALLAVVPVALISLKWVVSTGLPGMVVPALLLAVPIAGSGGCYLSDVQFASAVQLIITILQTRLFA